MKAYKVLLAGALALAAGGWSPAQAKEWKTVTITLEGAYAPWNLTNPDGTLGGFEPELAKYLCAHMKVECKLVASDWDGMIASLNAGKFDVIMDALSITEERKKIIDFSIPYAHTHAAFAAPKDSSYANAPGTGTVVKIAPDMSGGKEAVEAMRTAFKGATIGIQAATVYAKFIYDNFGDIATVREYKTSAERDIDLETGRIDLAFDDATTLSTAFEKANGALAFSGPEIGGTIFGTGEGLGVRQSDPELKAMLDDAIKAALADGTVKELSMKWFKTDVTP
ncbi:ABC transporter substrate-binding protein [Phyllobacterium salinisoli]|uniref:ABC transporter substrate-binding protein n=1 Tax=Phyllobacterium salinisoli TaxID=1899321 RepID=A0A368K8F9_9HYPH|nr:transporter substrate-binding domain-containing protein [Phyllobacterium salinisoli]RCS24763.1 ABC transporter substrate-binding protein [Phyllobacterium salinisoli]